MKGIHEQGHEEDRAWAEAEEPPEDGASPCGGTQNTHLPMDGEKRKQPRSALGHLT